MLLLKLLLLYGVVIIVFDVVGVVVNIVFDVVVVDVCVLLPMFL